MQRGSLVPDLRGTRMRSSNMSMNDFLAGLISEEEEQPTNLQEGNPYDENDPSCCSSRGPDFSKDFPFANFHTLAKKNVRFVEPEPTFEPRRFTLDQFVQGLIDESAEEEEQQPAPIADDIKPKKTKKGLSQKKPVEPETTSEEVKEPVIVEEQLKTTAPVDTKGKMKMVRRKRKTTGEEASPSKKVRPTPPSSPSVGSDTEK